MSLEKTCKKKTPQKKYFKKICFFGISFLRRHRKTYLKELYIKSSYEYSFPYPVNKKKTFLIFKVIYREYFFRLLLSFRNIWITDNGHGKFDEGCFLLFLYEM